jgi:hypothetical protein
MTYLCQNTSKRRIIYVVKTSMELFKVHKNFTVTFNLIVENDEENKNFGDCVNKYSSLGNEYLKIVPHPFLTIDISSRQEVKSEGWHSGLSFNLNRRDTFSFILDLRYISRIMHEKINQLFYYNQNEVLQINLEEAQKYKRLTQASSKQIIMIPSIIITGENEYRDKGIIMAINSYTNYTYLSIDEVDFLLFELSKVDFSGLTLQLLNTYKLTREMEAKEIPKSQPVAEEKEEEIIDVKKKLFLKQPNVLPDI